MGNEDFEVELDSIARAVGIMSSTVVDEMTSLCRDFVHYLQGLDKGAWSTEGACQDFANAYVDAIEAYDQVLQGVKADVVRYRDELHDAATRYQGKDDYVQSEMNLLISQLDQKSAGDRMGRIAYEQRPLLDDQRSGPAPAPTDTSPGQ
ncbi:hypothetical protein ACXR2U_22575 [Jatrophihabitans sp. YIM 134969]